MADDPVRAWDELAGWWDATVGEGNAFQTQLIGPATERLLTLREGEQVLDIACGNGNFARRMAQLGARVVAVDASEAMLERARERTTEPPDRIEYRLADATDEAQLTALGVRRFDAAVCTMALMDLAAIEPLARALRRLLTAEGRFVFSVSHPCFNSSAAERLFDGDVPAVKVTRYATPWVEEGIAIAGQPRPHLYFNRPLHALLEPFLRRGFVLDALEEPVFAEPPAEQVGPLSRRRFTEIPMVLVVRLRPPR